MTLPAGHIDIEAYSPKGERIDELGLHFTPSRLTDTLRRQGGIAFTADFKKVLPPDTVFKLSFHRARVGKTSKTFQH